MKERGSAMMTAVVSVMVLLLISGIFFSIIVNKAKQDSSEENALRAYYLAEAGINYEEAHFLQDYYNGADLSGYLNQKIEPEPFHLNDGSSFTVYLESYDANYITVVSTGTYKKITRTLKEKYKYK